MAAHSGYSALRMALAQKLVPGIVGISTYVDFAYQKEMQRAAVALAGGSGPINQLRTVTVTLDFNALIENLRADRRAAAEEQVAHAIQTLQIANADFFVITSGTTSTLTRLARQRVSLPFLDIAASCFKPQPPGGPIGLLSTSYTVTGGQFHAAAKPHGIAILAPEAATARNVDRAIFDDLVNGTASPNSMQVLQAAIGELIAAGAKSIILGNTDLTLIAGELQKASAVPLIDATTMHAREAAGAAMTGKL